MFSLLRPRNLDEQPCLKGHHNTGTTILASDFIIPGQAGDPSSSSPYSAWVLLNIPPSLSLMWIDLQFFTKGNYQMATLSTEAAATELPLTKPTWGSSDDLGKVRATWLGHACYYVQLPGTEAMSSKGPRILFDPVFSDRCSPSQHIGPKRYTRAYHLYSSSQLTDPHRCAEPPCKIQEIPEVDVVVISVSTYEYLRLSIMLI